MFCNARVGATEPARVFATMSCALGALHLVCWCMEVAQALNFPPVDCMFNVLAVDSELRQGCNL